MGAFHKKGSSGVGGWWQLLLHLFQRILVHQTPQYPLKPINGLGAGLTIGDCKSASLKCGQSCFKLDDKRFEGIAATFAMTKLEDKAELQAWQERSELEPVAAGGAEPAVLEHREREHAAGQLGNLHGDGAVCACE